jgi:hypothetical protein
VTTRSTGVQTTGEGGERFSYDIGTIAPTLGQQRLSISEAKRNCKFASVPPESPCRQVRAYFEGSGDYRVTVTVSRKLEVTMKPDCGHGRIERRNARFVLDRWTVVHFQV